MSIGLIMFFKAIVLAAFGAASQAYKRIRKARPRGTLVFCKRSNRYIDPVIIFERRVKAAFITISVTWLAFTAIVMWQIFTAPMVAPAG